MACIPIDEWVIDRVVLRTTVVEMDGMYMHSGRTCSILKGVFATFREETDKGCAVALQPAMDSLQKYVNQNAGLKGMDALPEKHEADYERGREIGAVLLKKLVPDNLVNDLVQKLKECDRP